MGASDRRARANEEAAQWWLQLSERELPRAEREQFIDWLRESPLHVAEMLQVAQVHGALETFERWAYIVTDEPADESHVVPFPRQSPPRTVADGQEDPLRPTAADELAGGQIAVPHRAGRPWRLASIAAGVCTIAIAVMWLAADFRGETIATKRGERREVTLADGSVLQVGPETRLRVRFGERERRIVFNHGATLFRVAKDAARPFVVEAEHTVVRAVGTAFGVERRDKGVIVTVSEGRVAVVEAPQWTMPFVPQAPPKLPEVALAAGQQVAVARAGEVGRVRKVDSDRELAWAAGRLVFENDPVADVVEEFNRYNRLQLRVVDDALARRPISAVFDASDPESFIAFMESVASVRIIRTDGQGITIESAHSNAAENTK